MMSGIDEMKIDPCKTCGVPSAFPGADHCTNCWEVEQRLNLYLLSENGRSFASRLLSTRSKLENLKSGAAKAQELFDEDELERYSGKLEEAKKAVIDGHVEDIRSWITHGEEEALEGFLRQWLKLDGMTLSEIKDQHGCYLPDEEE
jgi:hypothetical protein